MLNLFKRFQKPLGRDTKKADFLKYFYSQPEHHWILSHDKVRKTFDHVWERVPTGVMEYFYHNSLCFVTQADYRKIPLEYNLKNTLVVFPKMIDLLLEEQESAMAFVAHEIGLTLYELESPVNDAIMAEIEADKFVCDLGLERELEKFLLAQDESPEKRLRLTYLTINHFKDSN